MKKSILLISTEKETVKIIRGTLKSEYEVLVFNKLLDGIDMMRESDFDIILLDDTIKEFTLAEANQRIKGLVKDVLVIELTKDKREKNDDSYDTVIKPINESLLEKTVEHAIKNLSLVKKNRELENKLEKENNDEIIGQTSKIMRLRQIIDETAKMDSTVLILGETGTGKELVAREIFKKGERREKIFNSINCTSISSDMIGKELFGYEKGSLIGPNMPQKGIIELTDGGTLFIDAIEALDLKLQLKLLKIIEYGKLKREESAKIKKVNVRLIIATNKNLEEEVKKGKFRKDLYHRLTTYSISVPALRERKEDIQLLSNYFLNKIVSQLHKGMLVISGEVMKYLIDYSYPGNIKELQNIVDRMAIIATDKIIDVSCLPLELKMKSKIIENRIVQGLGPLKDILEKEIYDLAEAEKVVIAMALQKTRWNKQETAKLLGIGRTTLYEKIRKYGLDKEGESKN